MALDSNSGLQYGRKHGLFLNHRNKPFSPGSCIAGMQNSVDSNVTESIYEESRLGIMEITTRALNYEEDLIPVTVGNAAQATTTAPHEAIHIVIQSLLLELPDLGPAAESDLTRYSKSIAANRYPCLAKHRLPLLSVDLTNDQGMAFPPHTDRLHKAMLLRVDNERITTTVNEPNESEHFVTTVIRTVFDVEEEPITAPPSLEPKPPSPKEPQIPSDEDMGLPSEEAPPPTSSASDCSDCQNNKALEQGPNVEKDSSITTRNGENKLMEHNGHGDGIRSILHEVPTTVVDRPKSPSNSFFEDAFFPELNDMELCNDSDLQHVCQMLEQVDALVVPIPKLPLGMNCETTDLASWRGRLRWDEHQHLQPIPINPADEAGLLWVPLPPGPVCNFADETLTVEKPDTVDLKPMAGPQADRQCRIHIIDTVEDGELQECTETITATEPKPLAKPNAFSSLIKLRLQENANHQAPKVTAKGKSTSGGDVTTTPVLPNTEDPGATSKLVAAFMALRGTKRPRVHTK